MFAEDGAIVEEENAFLAAGFGCLDLEEDNNISTPASKGEKEKNAEKKGDKKRKNRKQVSGTQGEYISKNHGLLTKPSNFKICLKNQINGF